MGHLLAFGKGAWRTRWRCNNWAKWFPAWQGREGGLAAWIGEEGYPGEEGPVGEEGQLGELGSRGRELLANWAGEVERRYVRLQSGVDPLAGFVTSLHLTPATEVLC